MSDSQARAEIIGQEIDASVNFTRQLSNRWDAIENIYYSDPVATRENVVEGMTSYPFSLWRIKADKIISETVASLMSLSPIVQVIEDTADGTNHEEIERIIQGLLTRADYETEYAVSAFYAANCNCGPMRIRAVPVATKNGKPGVKIECQRFDPRHFVCYPTNVQNLKDARLIGHRFYQTIGEIRRKYDEGLYTSYVTAGNDNPYQYARRYGQQETVQNAYQSPIEDRNAEIECFELIRLEPDGKRTLIVYAKTARQILKEEPYEYEIPYYTATKYLATEETVITNDSLGNSVQGLCVQHCDIMNAISGGAFLRAYGALVLSGTFSSEKVTKIKPGDVLRVPPGTTITPLVFPFDPTTLLEFKQELEQLVEQTLGLSSLATSGTVDPNQKATALNIQANADQRKMAAYLRTASQAVKGAGEIVLDLIRKHYNGLVAYYGPAATLSDPESRFEPYRLVVTGQSGESNPDVMAQKLSVAAQIAMRPGSEYDMAKIDDMTMQAVHLPFDYQRLKKDGLSDVTALAAQLQEHGLDPMQVMEIGYHAIQEEHASPLSGNRIDAEVPGVQGVPGQDFEETEFNDAGIPIGQDDGTGGVFAGQNYDA